MNYAGHRSRRNAHAWRIVDVFHGASIGAASTVFWRCDRCGDEYETGESWLWLPRGCVAIPAPAAGPPAQQMRLPIPAGASGRV